MKFQSQNGKPDKTVTLQKTVRTVLLGLGALGLLGGSVYLYETHESPAAPKACADIKPNSVYTTGSPTLDARIAYVIDHDTSNEHATSGEVVKHIWEKKNFAFPTEAAQKAWDEAIDNAKPDLRPLLSVTKDGVIVPFPATAKEEWGRVIATPAKKTTATLVVGRTSNKQPALSVPVVLQPLSADPTLPAPIRGDIDSYQLADTKAVCDAK